MKNIFKFIGIIALVAIIGFGMAACSNGSSGGDTGGDKGGGGGGGKVTVTGLTAFNDKFLGVSFMKTEDVQLSMMTYRGLAKVEGSTRYYAKISNGTAKVDLFDLNDKPFNGDFTGVAVIELNGKEAGFEYVAEPAPLYINVTITKGAGTIDYSKAVIREEF